MKYTIVGKAEWLKLNIRKHEVRAAKAQERAQWHYAESDVYMVYDIDPYTVFDWRRTVSQHLECARAFSEKSRWHRQAAAKRVKQLRKLEKDIAETTYKELVKDEHWEADNIGYIQEASDKVADKVINSPRDGNGRSKWYWVRLATGDLVLACYPQGDMYFETENDRNI